MNTQHTPRQRGFTLIELIVVVAILGILASIAITSYKKNIGKSRRTTAQACLLERAQYMERYYTTNMTYSEAAIPTTLQCVTELTNYYTFSNAPTGTATASTYTLTATATTLQAGMDTNTCTTMTVTNTDVRKPTSGCW